MTLVKGMSRGQSALRHVERRAAIGPIHYQLAAALQSTAIYPLPALVPPSLSPCQTCTYAAAIFLLSPST
jgi:hypothetical protein